MSATVYRGYEAPGTGSAPAVGLMVHLVASPELIQATVPEAGLPYGG